MVPHHGESIYNEREAPGTLQSTYRSGSTGTATNRSNEGSESWNATYWNCMYDDHFTSCSQKLTELAAMSLALDILGIPCYHGLTLIGDLRDTQMWNEALDAKYINKGSTFTRKDWDELLGHWSAVADLPAIAFAEDLINSYPDAKVILVERDIEQWFASFNTGVILNVWNPVLNFIARLDSHFVGKMAGTSRRWTEGWMEAHSKEEMQDKAREKYRQHYELVERVIAPERLLKFELKDGWSPLCEFLGKPIPTVAFPRVNESAALSEKIGLIAQRGLVNILKGTAKAISIFAVLAIAIYVFRARV